MLDQLLSYWYFHLPNYLLAVLGYTLIARFLLGFFVAPDWDNYIWRFFRRLTDPCLLAAGYITPRQLSGVVLPVIAAFWTFLIRFLWFLVLSQAGLMPTLGQG
ncbi:MAG: YggT family protein [Rhodospirillaceae bacterium]|jgi:YggT family protein|nr:YggT family protein [Rhodospirillaceae bacterium]